MRSPLMIAALAALVVTSVPAGAATPIAGRWLTTEKDSIIEIGACGNAICGRIAKLLADTNGPPNDRNNPDPKLRSAPLIGLAILSGFKDRGSQWEGRIYDPKNGKSYKSKVFRNADGTLTVKGCISFFCRSYVWTAVR